MVDPDGWLWHVPLVSHLLLGGSTYGETLGALADGRELDPEYSESFSGVARDGSGGAVVATRRALYHVDRDGGATELVLTPSLVDFPVAAGASWKFSQPKVEVAPSGTIYLVEPHARAIVRAVPE